MAPSAPQIQTRDDLLFALTIAAELEHSLTCQYLFAAYTLKKSHDEGGLTEAQAVTVQTWTGTLTEIARQEMEHLGLVNNLMTAIGGAPHFRRPNFPQATGAYGIPLSAELEPLSIEALERFIAYEKPYDPDEDPGDTVPVDLEYTSIHDLYRQIDEAFARLDEETLFIGPIEAQVDNEVMHQERLPQRYYGVLLHKVTDRASARHAIEQIIEEGEGAEEDDPNSHYNRLVAMKAEYEALAGEGFAPARAVVKNPITRRHHRAAGEGTRLTHPSSRAVAELFDTAYETLLLALGRFYTRTTETQDEMFGLQRTAFFPLMVMALRPLAEILTAMPAFEDGGPERAGPPFEFYRTVQYLPQKQQAWTLIHERLWEMADAAAALVGAPEVPERMVFIAENLDRVAFNFGGFMGLPPRTP